ncbi:MAG: Tol-Pal system beta propeller repeat protein TolB [Desulfuromonadales bacterium]|nr:Tol-Pal system beta propeller repeat protein TolB [Desulfuromonadales bacterium]
MTKKIPVISFIAIILLFVLFSVASAEGFLKVTASGSHQLTLAIAQPTATAGGNQKNIDSEIVDILKFDLNMTGLFTVTTGNNAGSETGGLPSLLGWQKSGADILLQTAYSISGELITVEARLHDTASGQELFSKRYTGNLSNLRKVMHTISDEVLRTFTGELGPFTGKIAFVSTATGNKEIYIMDWDGYNVTKITNNKSINLNPDFSPSGKELIYTSYKNNNPDLYRRELFSGTEAKVSSHHGINITGAFSPDGNKIALALSKDGNAEIYVMNKDGKELKRLTKSSSINVSPTWSPDGSKIAFVSDRYGSPQVFIMNSDGSGIRRLTTSGSYNFSPRWSPKGDQIVYCRQDSGIQIYSINVDGSGDKQLTSTGRNEHPRWSPDGRFIVFSSRRSGVDAIYVMRSDGSNQTKVSRSKGAASHPTWSARW